MNRRRPTVRWAALTPLLVAFLLGAAGCEGPAFITRTIAGDPKTPAVFTLDDRPTLVMIDDPSNLLGSSTLPGVVAANAVHHLKENGVLTARVIPSRELADLSSRLGTEFQRTPIDQIGRELGAEQVIYALIESAHVQPAPGFYRPVAAMQVKVIDVETGERLFPKPPPIHEPGVPSRGRTLVAQLRIRSSSAESPGTDAMMFRRLAEECGLRLAQLFYEHKPRPAFDD